MSIFANIAVSFSLIFSSLLGLFHHSPPVVSSQLPHTLVTQTTNPALTTSTDAFVSQELEAQDDNYELYAEYNEDQTLDRLKVVDKKTNQETVVDSFANPNKYPVFILPILVDDGTGHYIEISDGTSVQRGIEIYSLLQGRKVASFCADDVALFWHNTAIYRTCDDTEPYAVYWEVGLPSIEAINLTNGQTKELVASSTEFVIGTPQINGDTLSYSLESIIQLPNGAYSLDASSTIQKSIDFTSVLNNWP